VLEIDIDIDIIIREVRSQNNMKQCVVTVISGCVFIHYILPHIHQRKDDTTQVSLDP